MLMNQDILQAESFSLDFRDPYKIHLAITLCLIAICSFVFNPVDELNTTYAHEQLLTPFVFAWGIALISFRNLWHSFGKRVGICELGGAIASIQWLVAPMLSYWLEIDHHKHYMYVSSNEYFSYAVPGTAMFLTGLNLPFSFRQRNHLQDIRITSVPLSVCWGLLAIGIIGMVLPRVVSISSLAFVFYILGNLRFAAALMFFFSQSKLRWIMPVVVIFHGGIDATSTGMFHDALLWAAMFSMYFFLKRPKNTLEKILIIVVGVAVVFTVQIVKSEFRELLWDDRSVVFSEIVYEEMVAKSSYTEMSEIENVVNRLNQGWIISRIIQQVPISIPYAEGETFGRAFESALLPRFVAPNKEGAGGSKNMRRFTGLEVNQSTSMGVSILGEGYGNFGCYGGCGIVFFTGVLLHMIVLFSHKLAARIPYIFFFFPVIFQHAIKAETDSIVVLNFMVKSSILCFCVAYLLSLHFRSQSQ